MRTTRNQDQRPSPMPPGGCVRTVERTHRLLRREPDMDYGYGLWPLVIINSAIFIVFALSFFRPGNSRDWKAMRSEEHTSELQSLMRISYAVFCLNTKKNILTK